MQPSYFKFLLDSSKHSYYYQTKQKSLTRWGKKYRTHTICLSPPSRSRSRRSSSSVLARASSLPLFFPLPPDLPPTLSQNPRSLPAPSPELRIPSAAAGARPRASPWASCSRGSSRRSPATARPASSSSASTMPARPPYSVSRAPPVSPPSHPRISAGPLRICGALPWGFPIVIRSLLWFLFADRLQMGEVVSTIPSEFRF